MRSVWLFNVAQHKLIQIMLLIHIIIIIMPFPCNASIPPIEGVEKAQTIYLAFMHAFYMSFILSHMNARTHCGPRVKKFLD